MPRACWPGARAQRCCAAQYPAHRTEASVERGRTAAHARRLRWRSFASGVSCARPQRAHAAAGAAALAPPRACGRVDGFARRCGVAARRGCALHGGGREWARRRGQCARRAPSCAAAADSRGACHVAAAASIAHARNDWARTLQPPPLRRSTLTPQSPRSAATAGSPLPQPPRADASALPSPHRARCVGRTQDGDTPLHNTAYRGHVSTATLLLEHGANKAARNDVRHAAHRRPCRRARNALGAAAAVAEARTRRRRRRMQMGLRARCAPLRPA